MFKRFATVFAALGVAAGALTLVASPASAADQYNVTGKLPAVGASSNDMALCAVACINGGALGQNSAGASLTGTPGYHHGFITDQAAGDFMVFPEAGTYRVAVKYTSGGYSATGYLQATDGGYKITSDYSAAAGFTVTGAADLGTLSVVKPAVVTPPAPSGNYSVSGAIKWSNPDPSAPASSGFTVALCETECVASHLITTEKTGRNGVYAIASGEPTYSMPGVPASSAYRMAVSFNKDYTANTGYLQKQANGTYKLVSFSQADVISLTDNSALDATVAVDYTAPEEPAPAPNYARANVMPVALTRGSAHSGFRFDVTNAVPSTVVTVKFFGCAGKAQPAFVKRDDRGGNRSIYVDPNPSTLGPAWSVQIVVEETGRVTRTEGWNKYGGPTTSFHCASAAPKAWVAKVSKKRGTAVVKHRVSVTATKLSAAGKRAHASVQYRWYADGKVVSSKRTLLVGKNLRGKTLVAKVTVGKSGYTPRVQTINFGRVR